jgi:pantoate--beta-alanine ligase
MILFKKAADLSHFLAQKAKAGNKIGFVPTMGALHPGHISLIDYSKMNCALTVCSIFVNPTQFNDAKDFEKYPVTLDKDIDLLEKNGCDVLFLPDAKEIYPNGLSSLPHYDIGYLETVLEGKYRSGHFQGVCQVVHKLLDIVKPHNIYLGQKDYQQCMVIKKLIALTDIKTDVIICPTLREPDGLAMSSRNMRLNVTERKKATKISETLQFIKKEIKPGQLNELKDRAVKNLTTEGFKADYVEIANAATLEIINNWDGALPIVAIAAAYLNEIRLIDNLLLQ